MKTKICNRCNIEWPIEYYHKHSMAPDGKRCVCKECHKKAYRESGSRHPNQITVSEKECSECKTIQSASEFYKRNASKDGLHRLCKKCEFLQKKKYRTGNIELIEKKRKYYWDNVEYIREKSRRYRKNNREKINKKTIAYNRKKCAQDINYRLRLRIRKRISDAVKRNRKSARSMELLGCSIQFLREYLESRFLNGMTWENYGYGNDKWHIDHIIPCAAFDLSDPEQQKKCFHYTNLQPLWAIENHKKGNLLPDGTRGKIICLG